MRAILNLILLFKQSIKSIFKFKIQFLAILLLSFLSVLVLTTSLTIKDRLNSTYDSVVKNVEKFDYQQSDQLSFLKGETQHKISKELMLLFIPENSKTTIDDKQTININFNSIYGKTYITEAFEKDDRMLKVFKANVNEKTNFDSIAFFWITRLLLLESFYSDLDLYFNHNSSEADYLENIPIFPYIDQIENKDFISNDLSTIKLNLEQINFNLNDAELEEENQLNNNLVQINDIVNIQNKEIYIFASNAFASLFSYIREYTINENWRIDDKKLNGAQIFQFITGQDLNKWQNNNWNNQQWIVNEQNKLSDVVKTNQIKDQSSNYIKIEGNLSEKENNYEAILRSGLKGKSTPIAAQWNDNDLILSANIDSLNLNPLSLNSDDTYDDWSNKFSALNNTYVTDELFSGLFAERNIEWITWNSTNYSKYETNSAWTNNMALNYRMFLKASAAYANMNIEFRKEFNVFDSANQIHYKNVIIDKYNYTNLKILNSDKGGRMPLNKGEVLISPQYAKAHKIKNNDEIKIGPQVFTVVGIATDTFSYYPIVDENIPLPQYKNSAIIYASEETFFPIIQNSNSSNKEQVINTTINYFLWSNDSDKENNINLFKSLNPSVNNIKTFDESSYRYSWILQPRIISGMLIVMLLMSVIICVISILGIIIYIKKMVRSNIKQIGILKALGFKSFPIACSYGIIGLIILILVIPITWVIGTLMQFIFINMFIPYFSIQLSEVSISLTALMVGLFAFGFFAIILSVLIAYFETKQEITLMFNSVAKVKITSKLMELINNVFNNSKFTLRFSLIVSTSALKNTITTITTIFISSFLVFFGLSIPAIVQTTKNGYYNSLNYSNYHVFEDLVSNAPLSKSTISYTNDLDLIDSNYTETSLMYSYMNPNYSYDSSFDASPFSKYMYVKGVNQNQNIMNSFKLLVNDSNNQSSTGSTGLFSIITEQFGNNFANGIGSQFSVGMIDQALSAIMNSYYDATAYGTNDYYKVNDDYQNNNQFNIITKNLTEAVPLILSAILGNGTGESTGNWKDDILNIILKNVPTFVEGYLQDPSRKEQYAFGYNVKKVEKKSETLATEMYGSIDKFSNVKFTGINANQAAFTLPNEKIFTSQVVANNIQDLINNEWDLNQSIIENGYTYYDAKSKTLSIPIIPNKQALNKYDLKLNSIVNNNYILQPQLKFAGKENNEFLELPRQAWVYNDSDFINSDYFKHNFSKIDSNKNISHNRTGSTNNIAYLDPSDLDNNKFTYKYMYSKQTDNNYTLNNMAYLFNDFAIDDKNQGISYVRPYYQYENIELYLPQNLISNERKKDKSIWSNYSENNPNETDKGYFEENIDNSKVPSSVKHAWESLYPEEAINSKYIKIKPYSLSYKKQDITNPGLELIVDKTSNYVWYADAIRAGLLKQEVSEVKYLNSDIKIQYKVVGILDSYNSSLILMDQQLANTMLNFSNAKKQDVKNNIFEDDPKVKAGETISANGKEFKSEFDRYELHDDNEDIYLKDWTNMLSEDEQSISYSQHMWSNAKYSNVEEAIDLTTGIWQTISENNGLLMLGQSPLGNISHSSVKTGILNSKLLLTEKELINQVTELAIAIGSFFIIIVILTTSLLIMLIGDIYIASFQRFMILMKSFGYSNWKVQKYAFGVVTIASISAWIIATFLSAIAAYSISIILTEIGLAVPIALTWWPFVLSAFIVGLAYFGSLIIVTKKVRKGKPSELLNETNE
ncbi:ABC transporter permease [Mesoplasma chauliocola]|uniref:ABC transporter permease n=1 Tax=Mesoplasma chauliocola TaxID=216427 RepID=A0A249SN15_9MOLU|nr:ABC transporter permease [Mesoplasma chauliocola]ASZ09018.1 ABC transporter permease [Mesoplasma chauliocola]